MNHKLSYILSVAILLTGILPVGAAPASKEIEQDQNITCDQAALDQAEAAFRSRLSENGQVPLDDSIANEAAIEYIRLSKDCYDTMTAEHVTQNLQGEEPVLIDEGAIDRYSNRAEGFVVSDPLAKWGAATLGTAGGTVTFSFMGTGLNLSNEGVPGYGNSVAITALSGFNVCFLNDIRLAFAAWSAVSDIKFVEVADSNTAFDAGGATGDIRIGAHTLDGPFGTLAHAYLPYNYLSGDGDIHFDKDENWTCNTSGFDIGLVALHEIGHAIGLMHENTSAVALMDPYYNSSLNAPQNDDINGAQAIYGVAPQEVAAPPNDDFASPKVIGSLPYSDSLDTTAATQDTTDPDEFGTCDGHTLNIGNNTVWYRYTATATGKLYMDTLGSDYDTYIAVWTGTEGNLSLVACDDDNNDGLQSELIFNATNGTTYHIEVAEYNGQGGSPNGTGFGGNLKFHVDNAVFLYSNRKSPDFGEQLYYNKSVPITTTLTNYQSTNVQIGSFVRSSGQFLLSSNTCAGATLTPGQNCTFDLQFKPTAYGVLDGTLTINSNATNSPLVITMRGVGLPGTQLVTQGGSFEQDNDNDTIPDFWNTNGLTSLDGRSNQYAKHGTYSMKIVGKPGAEKTLKKTIMKNGSAGDDFLYVMWSRAQNVPNGFKYRTQISFYNGGALVHQRIKDYTAGTHDWEYRWLPITVPGNYTRIEIEIIYSLSSGTAWFDSNSLKWAP